MTDLAKLNRLRINAGKPELKSWKASGSKLQEAIQKLEAEGHVDVLPGANVNAQPMTTDPEIAAAEAKLAEERKEKEEASAQEKKPIKVKSGLARGLDGVKEATHCRKSIQDARRDEVKLSKADKKQIKDEAELRKGEVDPKKDPDKAARQKKHIEEKQAKRKAEGKAPKRKEVSKDEITVADIARELGKSPKIVRAKLRRHEDKLKALHTKGQDRWTFPKSAKKEIVKILG